MTNFRHILCVYELIWSQKNTISVLILIRILWNCYLACKRFYFFCAFVLGEKIPDAEANSGSQKIALSPFSQEKRFLIATLCFSLWKQRKRTLNFLSTQRNDMFFVFFSSPLIKMPFPRQKEKCYVLLYLSKNLIVPTKKCLPPSTQRELIHNINHHSTIS